MNRGLDNSRCHGKPNPLMFSHAVIGSEAFKGKIAPMKVKYVITHELVHNISAKQRVCRCDVTAVYTKTNVSRWSVARAFPPAPLKTESFRL